MASNPFGMLMPGRKFNTGDYNFGFNGKWDDDIVKGTGNLQDYGMRMYDSRLGKFLSIDPKFYAYPFASPYSAFNNAPTIFIDPDGRGGILTVVYNKYGQAAALKLTMNIFVYSNVSNVSKELSGTWLTFSDRLKIDFIS